MPKLKNHSGAKKRFRVTGSGKIKYKKAGQRHLLTGMRSSRGRTMRRPGAGEENLEAVLRLYRDLL